jgi:hypothetical protein
MTRPPTEAAPLHLWRRCAKIDQRLLAKQVQIALASCRKRDNFLGDYRYNEIVSIHKSEGSARHFERDTHDALGLSVEFMAV